METTIFTLMTQMANAYGAVNLAQGFPDYEIDPLLAITAAAQMPSGPHQYAPMAGAMVLRNKIAEQIHKKTSLNIDPEAEITITAGATQAIFTAIAALVHTGDEVIVFEPAYDSYVPAIRLVGARPVFISLTAPDFKIDWDTVGQAISPKTRMVIINSPQNPSTNVWTAADMDTLSRLLSDTNIILLSDEVYEHIVFAPHKHIPAFSVPELKERTLSVYSFGKSLQITGWKLGYIIGSALLTKEFRKIHQYNVFSVHHPAQLIIAQYLDHFRPEKLAQFFEGRRKLFTDLMRESRFGLIPPGGSFFMLASYSDISDRNDRPFCEWIIKEKGVAAIPLSAFYHAPTEQKIIRFCLAKNDKTLIEAASRLCRI